MKPHVVCLDAEVENNLPGLEPTQPESHSLEGENLTEMAALMVHDRGVESNLGKDSSRNINGPWQRKRADAGLCR